MFEAILGNQFNKNYLQRALMQKSLPHALLFSGIEGIGKSLFAKELACQLFRSSKLDSPDFHELCPEGKSGLHSIEAIRQLIDEVHSAPFIENYKIFIIYAADRMQPAAANALLKTLEEPCESTILILLTSALDDMLPTIRSRCSILRFQPLSEREIASLLSDRGFQECFAKQAQGSAKKAFELAEQREATSLFRILSEQSSFLQRASLIESLEQEIQCEDPIQMHLNAERVFESILMWHRDQAALQCGLSTKNLFFPFAPSAQSQLPILSKVIEAVEEARLAYMRNMRFSVCLEKIFSA